MNILSKPQIGLSGQYRAEIRRNGIIIQETDWFDNLITDSGLNYLGGNVPVLKCKVGTGTNVPNVLDVSLSNELGSAFLSTDQWGWSSNLSAQVTNSLEPDFISSHTYACSFAQGSVVGNVTEVGIGPAAGNLFSRALITDNNSTPTTLTLLAIDQLTLYYKLTITPILTQTNGSVSINNVVYNYTCELINPSAAYIETRFLDGNFLPPDNVFFKTATLVDIGYVAATSIDYVNNSYTKGFKIICPIHVGNHANGISVINVNFGSNGNKGTFKYTFDTPIMKTNTQVLTLDLTRSWGRG